MESYRTEEEQVEALRKWWDEHGRSTIVAIVVALGLGFGYQGWQAYRADSADAASDLYQSMIQAFSAPALSAEQQEIALQLAEQLKLDYSGSTYAQFAAMQLARSAVANNDLAEAQAQLRWVLGKADPSSDVGRIAQLRLARVLASSGEAEQALSILSQGGEGPYQASYAVARGDVLLSLDRLSEASDAYRAALGLAVADDVIGVDLQAVEQKLQSLQPQPARVSVPISNLSAASTEVIEEAVIEEGEQTTLLPDDNTAEAEE
ncbi:MAG: tetratricopeptide repeat protein [Pseudomonadota bacterium]